MKPKVYLQKDMPNWRLADTVYEALAHRKETIELAVDFFNRANFEDRESIIQQAAEIVDIEWGKKPRHFQEEEQEEEAPIVNQIAFQPKKRGRPRKNPEANHLIIRKLEGKNPKR